MKKTRNSLRKKTQYTSCIIVNLQNEYIINHLIFIKQSEIEEVLNSKMVYLLIIVLKFMKNDH